MKGARDTRRNRHDNFYELVTLSAWGGALVIASLLFFYAGMHIDKVLDTEPFFMVGMLVLAVFLVLARLYTEYKKAGHRMRGMRDRHA